MNGNGILVAGIVLVALCLLMLGTAAFEAIREKAAERKARKARVCLYRARAEQYRKEVMR